MPACTSSRTFPRRAMCPWQKKQLLLLCERSRRGAWDSLSKASYRYLAFYSCAACARPLFALSLLRSVASRGDPCLGACLSSVSASACNCECAVTAGRSCQKAFQPSCRSTAAARQGVCNIPQHPTTQS